MGAKLKVIEAKDGEPLGFENVLTQMFSGPKRKVAYQGAEREPQRDGDPALARRQVKLPLSPTMLFRPRQLLQPSPFSEFR